MYEQAEAVRRELRALMERSIDPLEGAPFLIITASGMDKFVQFGGGVGEDLVLDLPRVVLADAEFERAKRLLPARGAPLSSDSEVQAFAANLGSDVDAAVEAVGVVLLQVFELDSAIGLKFEGM